MTGIVTFDPIWEEKYRNQHVQLYPWDQVVSFIFREAPRGRPRSDVHVLEIGCGTASNLWFAAREGFRVTGMDASPSAIAFAKRRFDVEGLAAELLEGDFTQPLPFAEGSIDLVIDRAALTCCGFSAARRALGEINRVLKVNGRMLFNPYADDHSSSTLGHPGDDGLVMDIHGGSLVGFGQICFYSQEMTTLAFAENWRIRSMTHLQLRDLAAPEPLRHTEWRVVAEKVGP